jgi:hypothetical protein
LATAARRWPVARGRSPARFGTCSEGFLCAPVAREIFLPQDVHIFLTNIIAVAGGGANAMDISKNVWAWRCTRCPARLLACCPGGGLLLFAAWASADVRHVLLQQPHARHPSPILEDLLSWYRLARGAFESFCRSFVFVFSPGYDGAHMVHPLACPTQSLGFPASPQRAGRWSPWTPTKKTDEQPLLLLVDTTIEGASPSHARQE